jgi:type II restriction enzyme
VAGAAADYEAQFAGAVRRFWQVRDDQAAAQSLRGVSDLGTRGAVTGGQHLNEVRSVIHRVLVDEGLVLPAGSNRLPGYYRGSKNWDSVVTYKGAVLAIIELKSQVGSFGKNQNNRIEEMLGQSLDIWRAAREEMLGPVRPWFGYVMLLEDAVDSRAQSKTTTHTLFPPDPSLALATPLERYRVAFDRMRLEGDLDAVCLAFSNREAMDVSYPDRTMTFAAFAAALRARVIEVKGMLG